MSSYEDKKQARIDRYYERAEKAGRESDALHKKSHDLVSGIPPGQPILVGHHSEKRHRNTLDRSWNTLGKAVEASEKADYYMQKAQAAENNTAISSDDPEAVDKLKEKLETLMAKHEKNKRLNKHYLKHGTCVGFEDMPEDTAKKLDKSIEKAPSWNKCPIPDFTLTNMNAKIRNTKKRIAKLEAQQELGYVGWEFDGGAVVVNKEENRLQIFFNDGAIPDSDKRSQMKSNGFHYSKYNNHAWQRQLNDNANLCGNAFGFCKAPIRHRPC